MLTQLQPIIVIVLTIVAYVVCRQLHIWCRHAAWSQPIILLCVLVLFVLWLCGLDVNWYQQQTVWLNYGLQPVTVALAVPIYNQWQQIRHYGVKLLMPIIVGGAVAPLLAWACVWLGDAPLALQLTVLAKSITTPLAMSTAQSIGGVAPLAAVIVIVTGIVGAVISDLLFRIFHIEQPHAQGIALGTVAHAVGTAKALMVPGERGAFASVSLCLNGMMTAIVLPLLFTLLS